MKAYRAAPAAAHAAAPAAAHAAAAAHRAPLQGAGPVTQEAASGGPGRHGLVEDGGHARRAQTREEPADTVGESIGVRRMMGRPPEGMSCQLRNWCESIHSVF
jgi:hypothetical protein